VLLDEEDVEGEGHDVQDVIPVYEGDLKISQKKGKKENG
jgi:hypothetical protein